MKIDGKATDKLNISVIAVAVVVAAAVIGKNDGLPALLRYLTFIFAIVADGMFLSLAFVKPRRFARTVVATLAMLTANCLVAVSVFPRLGLLVAFWIPGGIGFLIGRLLNSSGPPSSRNGRGDSSP